MREHRETQKLFAQLSDEILRALWTMNPVEATILGAHHYDHTLGDMSESAIAGHAATLRGCLTRLQSEVDPSGLGPEEELDYHVAMSLASSNLLMLERQRPWMNNPSVYPSVCIWGCFSLLVRECADPDGNVHSMLSRIREIPEFLEASKANISDAVPLFVEHAREVIRGACWFFGGPFAEIAARAGDLEGHLLSARDRAVAALQGYGEWLADDVLPHADGDFAIGGSAYGQLLFEDHYLTYTPQDLVLIGEEALRESEKQIEEIARRIDPSVTWQELVSRLKTEHPPKEGIVQAYRVAFESARKFVVERNLVTLADGERLDVAETPAFERAIVPYAGYFPPAPFGSKRSGCLWVTPINKSAPEPQQQSQLLGHCIYAIPIIAIHEGYPGHHVQLTRAMDAPSRLRKQAMNNLLLEGWAPYCEQMMYEQAFYTDPRVQLFQLKDMLWRACRVIIDVGLHTSGMTLDEAARLLVDKAMIEEENAVAEVNRYAMNPT
ncbi:MAG: DUF885 domain-containing protein, partial [Armatimonadetes bacterium]|nr:DUF885 domain-containing protein [Armatimonadota bacterium]